MRARITELDVRLQDVRIRVDHAKAQARLLYLAADGETHEQHTAYLLLAAAGTVNRSVADPALAAENDEVLYWVAPMDPNYRRDEPGKSPMGMDLVPVYANGAGDDNSVSINPMMLQNLGIRTATVERGKLWRLINTVGYVAFDERKAKPPASAYRGMD